MSEDQKTIDNSFNGMAALIISPIETNEFIDKILAKIGSEYEPEQVPVKIEPYAKIHNCYIDVEQKVKLEGGSIHFGWAIFQTDILCEAEHHAVYELENGDLIDISPREFPFESIMFVPDNKAKYTGQSIDNVRINITENVVVDDFILICECVEKLYSYGNRINDEQLNLPEFIFQLIKQYEDLKISYLTFIRNGGRYNTTCFCGSPKNYNNCHGKSLRDGIKKEMLSIKKQIRNSQK